MSRYLRVRMVLDRLVAAVGLVVLSPVIGVLGWLVHRHDGGPAFITVERVGRHGRPMRMWKLRSMRAESADGRATGVSLTHLDVWGFDTALAWLERQAQEQRVALLRAQLTESRLQVKAAEASVRSGQPDAGTPPSDTLIARDAVAIGAKCLWQQIGVASREADEIARHAGLDSVLDRCTKIEHARLFGGLNWAGVNTRVVSARRPV